MATTERIARVTCYPLRLLTLKRHYSINSSYGALPVLARAEPEPLLELHADDARARGIVEGQTVRVWNDRGSVLPRAPDRQAEAGDGGGALRAVDARRGERELPHQRSPW